MKTTGPLPPPPTQLTLAKPLPSSSAWRVGQVLNATAIADSRDGQTQLRVGEQSLQARSGELSLRAGQNLRLQVQSLGQTPLLKLLPPTTPKPDQISTSLRAQLPQQQPLNGLLSGLARASHPASGAVPAQLAQLSRETLAALPDLQRVSNPLGLRDAIRDSGLFLEPRLAADGRADSGTDFKANLLRLLSLLRQLPASTAAARPGAGTGTNPSLPSTATAGLAASLAAPGTLPLQRGATPRPQAGVVEARIPLEWSPQARAELQRSLEGALARIQVNQLNSLPVERDTPPEWLMELPIRRDQETDIWGLRIAREGNKDQQQRDHAAWGITLAFDLPGLGPMQARVRLIGEDQVQIGFWSNIADELREQLPQLHKRLSEAGLQVAQLVSREGSMPEPEHPAPKRNLLDERV